MEHRDNSTMSFQPNTSGPCHPQDRAPWLHEAIARIEADYQRSADTHLIPLRLPAFAAHGIDLYLSLIHI